MNLDPAGEMPEFSPTTYGDSVGTYAAVGNDSDAAKRAMESALRFRGLQNSLLHIPNTLENTKRKIPRSLTTGTLVTPESEAPGKNSNKTRWVRIICKAG